MKSFPFPERCDFLDDNPGIPVGNAKRRLGPLGKLLDGQIQKITVKLRIKDTVPAGASDTTRKELSIINIDGDIFSNALHGLGPAQNQRLTFGLCHGLGEVFCPFDINPGLESLETVQDRKHSFP